MIHSRLSSPVALSIAWVLLAQPLASVVDLGHPWWRPWIQPDPSFGPVGIALSALFLIGLCLLFASPLLVAASRHRPERPSALRLSWAAYAGASLAGHGMATRVIAGDGLEVLAVQVLMGLAALAGWGLGIVVDHFVSSAAWRWRLALMATALAVGGALAWGRWDAASFEARRAAHRAAQGTAAPASPTWPPGEVSPPGCLGRPSADGRIRLFTSAECREVLAGRPTEDGECLRPGGGSFSWDLRELNRSCR